MRSRCRSLGPHPEELSSVSKDGDEYGCRHASAFSRRISPELCLIHVPSSDERAQGMPGARRDPPAKQKAGGSGSPRSTSVTTRPSLFGRGGMPTMNHIFLKNEIIYFAHEN